MTLPLNWSRVVVTGRFIADDGTPLRGSIEFAPTPLVFVDASADLLIAARPLWARLNTTGAFSISLPCTDDVDVAPTAWTYRVTEPTGRVYHIGLPAYLGSVDLSDLAPIGAPSAGAVAPWGRIQDARDIDLTGAVLGASVVVVGVDPLVFGFGPPPTTGPADPFTPTFTPAF